jgi:hypothetical protein
MSIEEKLCLSEELPIKYKPGQLHSREYVLNTKPLILNKANISFRENRVPIYVAGKSYTHNAYIVFDRNSLNKEHALLTELEKNIVMLVDKTNQRSCHLVYMADSDEKGIQGTYSCFLTHCEKPPKNTEYCKAQQVEIYFPSINVFPYCTVQINAVLHSYRLD